jgi:hypothetical protein
MTTAGLVFSQVLLQLVMFQAPNEDVLMPDIVMPSDSIRSDDGGPNDETNTESFLESIKVEDLLMTARNALTADQFPEAMAAYTVATDRLPQDQRIQYNLGIAAYRAGDLETAARAFERSADSPNPELTAAALFNRGNVSYRQALDSVQAAQSEQQIQSAEQGAPDPTTLDDPIQALETAISHYRDAITTEPGNRDARRNAELAWRLKKALQEQQEQQEQEQDQEQQDQEQQDQEQQDQEQQDQEQQDQEQQDQEQQDQEQQDQEQQDQEQQDQEQQDQEQQDQEQQDQEQQDQEQQDQEQQDQEQQDQEQQDQEQQDQEQQDQEQQDQEQQDQEQQDQEQQDQEQQDQEQQDQEQESAKPGEGKSKNARMSEQQAEALLQMIRDKEKGRRAELEEREARAAARRYRPVEKDW